MIHTYGDSHAAHTFYRVPWTIPHPLGPVTMRRMSTGRTRKDRSLQYAPSEANIEHVDDTLLQDTINQTNLGKADVVIVSCGEGDVRCFIKPQLAHDHLTAEQYLRPLVAGYAARVAALETRGARKAILSVPPPATYERSYSDQWPPTAGDAERAYYTHIINHYLRIDCRAHGLLYVDVHRHYANDEGLLICELSDGGVHICAEAGVLAALKEVGIL